MSDRLLLACQLCCQRVSSLTCARQSVCLLLLRWPGSNRLPVKSSWCQVISVKENENEEGTEDVKKSQDLGLLHSVNANLLLLTVDSIPDAAADTDSVGQKADWILSLPPFWHSTLVPWVKWLVIQLCSGSLQQMPRCLLQMPRVVSCSMHPFLCSCAMCPPSGLQPRALE